MSEKQRPVFGQTASEELIDVEYELRSVEDSSGLEYGVTADGEWTTDLDVTSDRTFEVYIYRAARQGQRKFAARLLTYDGNGQPVYGPTRRRPSLEDAVAAALDGAR